ncbi:MAG TPA: cyclic nucleotide-binding domain-containing protein [Longimicrobium sp.]|jgi:CRP-like cAMP-binding protein/SAM-dependent methyltransferase|nr:cyclic nucleotide-binding domain-containing protein [Longimicrobium sp.]
MLNRAAALLEKLDDVDVDWIFSASLENLVPAGATLIAAGEPVSAVHIVQKGLLGVFAPGGSDRLGVVGPGGIVGEMSLLEERPPTETVTALEPTAVLSISHAALEERFHKDPTFGARFFRGMAKALSQRLRRTNSQLSAQQRSAPAGGETGLRVVSAVDELETAVARAEEAARAAGDAVPDDALRALREAFARIYHVLEESIGEGATLPDEVRDELGMRAQKEFLPYLLLTRNAERAYSRPRGYPGDFMTVEMIYQDVPRGSSRVGPALDRCWLDSPLCAGIRARRAMLAAEIARTLASADAGAAVLAIACGSAGELFDALEGRAGGARATLVDFDPQALAFVADRRDRAGLKDAVTLAEQDMAHLAAGRLAVDVPAQALVYSAGLLDLVGDAAAVKLLDHIHALLKPGGRVALAGMNPDNPCRAFMDHVLEWRVPHRGADELRALFAASAFADAPVETHADRQGVILLATAART